MALLVGAVFPLLAPLHRLDLTTFDLEMKQVWRLREPRPINDVVLVALDDKTLASVAEPMALMHVQVGAFLTAMADAHARAVAVDLVLPNRSYEGIAPGYDARLVQGILSMRKAGTLVLARTIDDAGHPRSIHAPFRMAAGEDAFGYALIPADEDGVVRRYDDRLASDGSKLPTLAGEVARRIGAPRALGYIDFSRHYRWQVIPLHQVITWARSGASEDLSRVFAERIVFLGVTLPLTDEHRVPVDADGKSGTLPGMFIHAHALENLRSGTLIRDAPTWLVAVLGMLCSLAWWLSRGGWSTAVIMALGSAGVGVLSFVALWTGMFIPAATLLTVLLVAATLRLVGETYAEMWVRRHLRKIFAGYVSPGVMAELEAGRLEGLTSARRFISVLFVDVTNFTSRAETEAPELVTAALNRLFGYATDAIHHQGGTVKEFMGDGVMALFGAPQQVENPSQAAFDAAREILAAMPAVNAALTQLDQRPLDIGMGLSCGEAVVGHIGAAQRHTYGAVGDCVNLASRLEGLSKDLGVALVMSADVAARLMQASELVHLGVHSVKGHSSVDVYGWSSSHQQPETPERGTADSPKPSIAT